MADALRGCTLRILRAQRYIQEAEDLLERVARDCEDRLVVNPDSTLLFPSPPAVPEALPLAISDAVHNLRSALDHLVYVVCWLDNGRAGVSGTQFPICDIKEDKGNYKGFDTRRTQWLRAMRQTNVDVIEEVQPYVQLGVDRSASWTRDLRDISNRDKHVKLTSITNTADHYFFDEARDNGPGRTLPNGLKLRASSYLAVQMVVAGTERIISSTLWGLLAGANDLVSKFRPLFLDVNASEEVIDIC